MNDMKKIPMPNGGFKYIPSREARFSAKVDVRSPNECWPWTAYLSPDGYGYMRDGAKMRHAAAVALELSGTPMPPPPNNHVLHSDNCTTRACCNPAHLRWGSNLDNVRDRERLGRNKVPHVRGTRHGAAKLDEDKVRAIRLATGAQHRIAAQYGVSQFVVSCVKRRVTWAHVK